ncbi:MULTISPECIES: carbohydrate ABC transporter permease [unclassified Variovorax]|uniref:carbohydrate ABC transporter permease n=1 Tax=unclassified Variovorax TaxID=663243 RepID=UPI001318D6FD|nr:MULTISPECIES: sugar ABC transporter permease [unclassified Variovorax]VTU13263.1 Inner membrane ABC transporter permease protein YcjO [Variovorax sp. SRS16]VTU17797.1 Inner membrane ABC transporter permease protein YcjO [Variovorax sp. PBL-E5]
MDAARKMPGATLARSFRGRGARTGFLFAAPAILFLLVFVAYPIVDAIRLSFLEIDFVTGAERFVGVQNFAEIFQSPKLGTVLLNTLVWSLGSLVGQFALGLGAALVINQDLPGMRFVRSVLLIPYVVPVITVALFWRWMLDGTYGIVSYGLQSAALLAPNQSPLALPAGAMTSVVLANIWRGFSFVMISYWAALQNIPKDQYEAASVDGANWWQQFRYVTLPNLAEVTRTLIVLRVIWTVTYFDLIWLITRGGPGGSTEHWPIWIYQETMGFFRFGYGAALATTLAAGLMLLALLYLRSTREKVNA